MSSWVISGIDSIREPAEYSHARLALLTAPATVSSCLVGDSYTQVAIDRELTDMRDTEEAASTYAVMAAAMLIEACGGKAQARQLAARWTRKSTARPAQTVNACNTGAA